MVLTLPSGTRQCVISFTSNLAIKAETKTEDGTEYLNTNLSFATSSGTPIYVLVQKYFSALNLSAHIKSNGQVSSPKWPRGQTRKCFIYQQHNTAKPYSFDHRIQQDMDLSIRL